MRRSFDAEEANRILNDPSVFPNIATEGMTGLDITPVIADQRNILLMAHKGALICCPDVEPSVVDPNILVTNGIYDLHTNFLKSSRQERLESNGPPVRNTCLAAYKWMFTRTDCMALVTKIPSFNRAAITFAPLLGWRQEFERKDAWKTDKGVFDLHFFKLSYDDWIKTAKDDLIETGHAFHIRLDQEFARHGKTEPQHPEDEMHDIQVGACIETIYGGQPEKAIVLYNRWARRAGYGQIKLVARSPMVIDIGNAVLLVEDKNFRIITCRPAH